MLLCSREQPRAPAHSHSQPRPRHTAAADEQVCVQEACHGSNQGWLLPHRPSPDTLPASFHLPQPSCCARHPAAHVRGPDSRWDAWVGTRHHEDSAMKSCCAKGAGTVSHHICLLLELKNGEAVQGQMKSLNLYALIEK